MKLLTAFFGAVLACALLPSQDALAEKRVALVIGDSSYKHVASSPTRRTAQQRLQIFSYFGLCVPGRRQ